MRWIYFLILAVATVVVQTTVGQVLWLPTPLGPIGPVFPAAVAVFVALYARSGLDAALAGWVLGFGLDLTLSGAGMGLPAILYALGAAGVFSVREAFFRDRMLTQAVLGMLFCVFAHELLVVGDAILAGSGGAFGRRLVQVLAVSAYTAVLTPVVCALLRRIERLLIVPLPGRQRR